MKGLDCCYARHRRAWWSLIVYLTNQDKKRQIRSERFVMSPLKVLSLMFLLKVFGTHSKCLVYDILTKSIFSIMSSPKVKCSWWPQTKCLVHDVLSQNNMFGSWCPLSKSLIHDVLTQTVLFRMLSLKVFGYDVLIPSLWSMMPLLMKARLILR